MASGTRDNTEEDFSPDFDFEAVPARLADGWSAGVPHPVGIAQAAAPGAGEADLYRLPQSAARHRIRTTNVPLGRDPSCFLCVAEELTGLPVCPKLPG